MPHIGNTFLNKLTHSDMLADVLKTLMVLFLISYLDERRKIPTFHDVAIATVTTVFYWAVIHPLVPGKENSCDT